MIFLYKNTSKIILTALLIFSFMSGLTANAQDTPATNDPTNLLRETGSQSGFNTFTPEQEKTIASTFIGTVYRWFVSFLGVVFMTYIIYGGYTWMTSSGNEEKITKAKKTISHGIWGLIIILASTGFLILLDQAISIGGSGSVSGGGS